MRKIHTGIGAVALLDALGVRTFSSSESLKFLHTCNELIDELGAESYMSTHVTQFPDGSLRHLEGELLRPKLLRFGDTILITPMNVTEGRRDPHLFVALKALCVWVRGFIALALRRNLLFRGAIAYGEYVTNWEDVFLGPVVSDAASWYEEPRLIGAMLTPNTGKHLMSNMSFREEYLTQPWFNRGYRLILRGTRTRTRGTVRSFITDWPAVFGEDEFIEYALRDHLEEIARDATPNRDEEEPLDWRSGYDPFHYIVDYVLPKCEMPHGTEDLYEATYDFVRESCNLDFLRRYPPAPKRPGKK